MADANVAADTKERTTKRSFVLSDGTEVSRATADVQSVRVIFVENDHVLDMNLDDLEPGVLRAAAAFGVLTSVTNTVGSSKLSLDEKIDAAQGRWEALQGGSWSAERESGPGNTDLVEAAARVQAARGKPWGDTERGAFGLRLKNEEVKGKDLLANPTFKAQYDAIKAERAMERAKVSAAKAKTNANTDGLDGLLG
jgi:hypothetical protein